MLLLLHVVFLLVILLLFFFFLLHPFLRLILFFIILLFLFLFLFLLSSSPTPLIPSVLLSSPLLSSPPPLHFFLFFLSECAVSPRPFVLMYRSLSWRPVLYLRKRSNINFSYANVKSKLLNASYLCFCFFVFLHMFLPISNFVDARFCNYSLC